MKRALMVGTVAVVSSFVFAVSLANTLAELLERRAEKEDPRCRYCNADCSDGRSWDGGDLYACPPCANRRALGWPV